MQLTGLNFNAGNMPAGDRGLVSWPARATEFLDNVDAVAGIGGRLGCRAFNALYGNRIDGESPGAQDELAVQNLAAAAAGVGRFGGTVLLEPVSGAPHYPLRTAEDTLGVIARVREESGAENLRLLADFYHLAVNGDDVAAVIEHHAGDFGHIQIADSPGRGAPGTGNLPLRDLDGPQPRPRLRRLHRARIQGTRRHGLHLARQRALAPAAASSGNTAPRNRNTAPGAGVVHKNPRNPSAKGSP